MKNFKNTLMLIFFTVLIGSLFGMLLYNTYEDEQTVFSENDTYYFLQEGAYSNKESMKTNTKNLDTKLMVEEGGIYYVYVAITKDDQVRDTIINLYKKEKNIDLYVKEKIIKNNEFKNNIEQFDLLLKNSTTFDEINSISDVILSNYEEIHKSE